LIFHFIEQTVLGLKAIIEKKVCGVGLFLKANLPQTGKLLLHAPLCKGNGIFTHDKILSFRLDWNQTPRLLGF
jgi:hypothetical protein